MHNIEYRTFNENVDKEKALREISAYVSAQAYLEGGNGIRKIRWLDARVLDNEDLATDYLKTHDNGNYDCLAVRFYQFDQPVTSDKIKALEDKLTSLYREWQTRDREVYLEGISAAYVSCKHCGSRLNTEMIRNGRPNSRKNCCPVCLEDLRPASTLHKIEAVKARYEKADADLDAARAALEKKMQKFANLKWLVKFEYHT